MGDSAGKRVPEGAGSKSEFCKISIKIWESRRERACALRGTWRVGGGVTF